MEAVAEVVKAGAKAVGGAAKLVVLLVDAKGTAAGE